MRAAAPICTSVLGSTLVTHGLVTALTRIGGAGRTDLEVASLALAGLEVPAPPAQEVPAPMALLGGNALPAVKLLALHTPAVAAGEFFRILDAHAPFAVVANKLL